MRFPKAILNKKTKAKAVIYGKSRGGEPNGKGGKTKGYSFYRVAWRADGKRLMKNFRTYSEAKAHAERMVEEIGKGSRVSALTPRQANDALAAFARLDRHYVETGNRLTLAEGAATLCDALARLGGRPLGDAVEGYLRSIANVKRVPIGEAMDKFIESRRLKTLPDPKRPEKRPKLSTEQHYLTSIWLKRFSDSFPGHAVCDLTKGHLSAYVERLSSVGPKTRNEHRACIRMFIKWAVAADYLPETHRLLEAEAMKREDDEPEEIDLFTKDEFAAMLTRASEAPVQETDKEKTEKKASRDYRPLLPVLALAGLAGLRFKEIIRLTWQDVFGRAGHIEVKASKSKTRSRRLIPICPALASWLESLRSSEGKVWPKGYDMLHEDFKALRGDLKIPDRRNGLRHAFISAHYAAHSDEGLTAKVAGNSPDMIHKHYKALMEKEDGEAWFAVAAAKPDNILDLNAVAPVASP